MSDPATLARAWIGTPYVHQASVQGAGCDCLGLLRGVWRALYGAEPCPIPPYSFDWSEAARREDLMAAADRWLIRKDLGAASEGDVLLFRMREGAVAKHIGIQGAVGENPSFIHAYSGHGVVESPLPAPWARKIVARYRFAHPNFA
ncbi:MAG: peptidase [Cypionkella sp.]|nr:peptidase [Cypionkella sp.]